MPAFVIEFKAKFQLEVREIKIVIPTPVQVKVTVLFYPPEIYPRTPVDPRLRTAVLSCDDGVLWQCLHASLRIRGGKETEA